MKNVIEPRKIRKGRDAEEIFLDVCRGLILVLLLGVVGYAAFS